ncbi:TonB-dependent receptor [Erythrobacter dokdonensis]|uniref:TonB-dependent receptor n=1 Tax=Erythrobacter dokdonensis DSW-74 TaxID=1300349 RepID=A0A1A7BHI3_9SPHN|nr:TonB-dependent receptor [Erythrobacter dokdonensis]OBV12013.1 TonB-dependent receptor [Erythrobacter dokdonensis DSW-74]
MRSTLTGSAGSHRFTLLAGAATIAFAMPGAALAQDQEPELEAPESSNVIIVTASKREQTLQETPIAVSVTSGEVIEQAQIRDVLDLQTVTPSLRVSQLQTSSASTFIIRGFGNGDNNFGVEPSVGVFIDGVFRSRSAGALSDLNNIQRIEVLNGPQSTLFGKNASAGVISIITKEPQFEFGGSVEANYGNFNNIFIRGDVTGPISDNIAFSLDGTYQKRDGTAEIVNLGVDQNDRNRWSTRGQLLIEPSADFRIRAIADYSRIDEVCCQVGTVVRGPTAPALDLLGGQTQDFSNFFNRTTNLNIVPENEVDNYGGSIQMDYQMDNGLSFTSITAYRELDNFFRSDIDYTAADIANEQRDQGVKTFTQEFRVASDFDGPINFLLGGFYFDETITQQSRVENGSQIRDFFELLAGGNPADILTGQPSVFNAVEAGLGLQQETIFRTALLSDENFRMENEAWSIFGTIDFEPIDGLVFTVGGNYTDDRKNFALSANMPDPLANVNLVDAFITLATAGAVTTRDQFQALPAANQAGLLAVATTPCPPGVTTGCNPFVALAPFQFQPPFLNVPNAIEDGRTNDDEFTYLLRASYEISPELNVYFSYSTGFKASSINLSRDSRPLGTDFSVTPGTVNSTFAAPNSPILDAGLAVPNLVAGTRFAGPEETEVYEIGLKGQFDGVGFNLAVFDQAIDGFQSFAFTGTGFALRNAGRQSVKGFEFDTTIQPTDGLVLTFAVTHLDPLFDDFTGSVVGDLSGVRPAGIPAWAISTSATHTHEWDNGTKLITRIDYQHESNVDINNGLPTFNGPINNRRNPEIFRREINNVNGAITLALNSGLEVGIWGRNLLDEEWILTVFDGVAQQDTVSGYPNQPRTYGGLVRFRF